MRLGFSLLAPPAKYFKGVFELKTTKHVEAVQMEDVTVSLETPNCDMKWPHCDGRAVAAIRVHGCAFNFACQSCMGQMQCRVTTNFERFKTAKCARCGLHFTHENYYKIITL